VTALEAAGVVAFVALIVAAFVVVIGCGCASWTAPSTGRPAPSGGGAFRCRLQRWPDRQAPLRAHQPRPGAFSAHSLRSGLATSAALGGAQVLRLANHGRRQSLATVRDYVRAGAALDERNPLRCTGL
jgi:hypothetical protein